MAKSALIDLLRQAYQLARRSQRTGIPTDEVVEQFQAHFQSHRSRRQVLHGGLALASAVTAASLGSGRSHLASAAAPILIVGAGLAGLTAAYRLRQAGVTVDVIEARSRVGGRVRTQLNAAGTAIPVDLGGEFIDSDHTSVRGLATELGLRLADLNAADTGLLVDTFYFENQRVSLTEITRDFAPLAPILERDAAIAEDLTTPAAIRLDRTSLRDYLDRQPISRTLRRLLEISYTSEYGREPDEQSCLNLLFLIGTDPTNFELYGASDERFQIRGGNQQLAQQLAQRLPNQIRFGTELEAIRSLPDGRYRVSLRSGASTFDRAYERILLTVPFSVLRTVSLTIDLPPRKQQAIHQLGYGTNSKLVTAYRDRVWRTRYGSTASVYTDLGFQNTWEPTRYASGNRGLVTNFTGGRPGVGIGAGTPDRQARLLLPQLERVFPGVSTARQGNAIRAYWTAERFTRGSYACYLVGQWSKFYGEEGKRVGNLFFAGEHTSLEFQGYMEGACGTGEAAAQEILRDLALGDSQTPPRILRRRRQRPQPR